MLKSKFLLLFFILSIPVFAQVNDELLLEKDPQIKELDSVKMDTIMLNDVSFSKVRMSAAERKEFLTLQNRVLKVYPYAKIAAERIALLDKNRGNLQSNRDKRRYFRLVEDYLDNDIINQEDAVKYLETLPKENINTHNIKLQKVQQFENGKYLKDIFLDNGYLLDPNHSRCVLENNNYKVLITPDHNYTYLQIYTPPHRKSIAIENLTGAPDSFNNKMGLLMLEPNKPYYFKTSYQLQTIL